MKFFYLVVFFLLSCTNTTYNLRAIANTNQKLETENTTAQKCTVFSVKLSKDFSKSLKPEIEQILETKGFKIIDKGSLIEQDNLQASHLKLTSTLNQKAEFLATSLGAINSNDNAICDDMVKDELTCEFEFHLYKISSGNKLESFVSINERVTKKVNRHFSKSKISNNFAKKFLNRAQNEIPVCN